MRTRRTNLVTSLFIFVMAWSVWTPAFADSVGNGADSIVVGGATKLFDQVEYDTAFLPAATGDVWTSLSAQIDVVKEKLPVTGRYLESFFNDGKLVWWFVNATLRDVHDSGASPVVVTWNMEQAALNNGHYVLIRQDIWDGLASDGRASLLLHEAMWGALGSNYIGNGSNVRLLSRLLLNPFLSSFSQANLGDQLLHAINNDQSPLAQRIEFDLRMSQTNLPFTVEEVQTGPRIDLLFQTSINSTPFFVSMPKPDPSLVVRVLSSNGTVRGAADENATLRTLAAEDICTGINYAGQTGMAFAKRG